MSVPPVQASPDSGAVVAADSLSRLAVESLPSGVLVMALDGTITALNRQLLQQFGYTREELIGQPVELLLPESYRAAHETHRRDFASHPEARPMGRSVVGRRKDGSELPVDVDLNPIQTNEGLFVLASIVQVTATGRAHETHRPAMDEASRFDRLIGNLTASFVDVRPEQLDGAIVDAIRQVVEALGLDRGSVFHISEDRRDFALTHHWARPGLQEPPPRVQVAGQFPWSVKKLLRGEEACFSSIEEIPDAVERESVRRFGTLSRAGFPLSVGGLTAGAITFGSNREHLTWTPDIVGRLRLLSQVFGSALSRRRADVALRTSEERFRTLADNAAAMIWVSGPDKMCSWFNRRWLDFVGRTMDQELGYGWTTNVHPDDVESVRQLYDRSFDAREPFSKEYRLRRQDGEWRWVLDSATPNFAADGTFSGYLGSCVDVTDQKTATQEVERLRDRLHAENVYLRREARDRLGTDVIVGQSDAIRRVLTQVEQVAPTDSTVLLLGETGTGKELFAMRIHELSGRRGRAMVRVNCAAIPATLIESELFGREKGAYTGALARQIGRFELADHSTIFLDEIGDLPPDIQVKLLRVLEEHQIERLGSPKPIRVDTRIVAATHRNLEQRILDGSFREDLYYRLNVFPIFVPPLRERVEDIPLLVWRFVDEFSKALAKRIDSIPRETMAALQRHTWPGNVRELRNVVERAMIVATGPKLRIVVPGPSPAAEKRSARLADIEKEHIRSVLETTRWRIRGAGGAADRLGLRPTTLETRMAKLGLTRPPRAS